VAAWLSEAVDVVRVAVAHGGELTRAVDLERHFERRVRDETAMPVGHFDEHVREIVAARDRRGAAVPSSPCRSPRQVIRYSERKSES
jgi:non-ribosomal peptide synthetase component F